MANIALALAFALSSLLSPGGRILRWAVEEPVLHSLPPYQGHLLLAFANYWVPAVFAYLALRLLRADSWLRPRPAIHVLLGLANGLIVFYVVARIFASTVQGGGGSFVVMSFAPIVIFPAWAMLAAGLIWLVFRSIRNRQEIQQLGAGTLGIREGVAIAMALGIPAVAVASTLFLVENAPFRLAKEAETFFNEKCKSAGEVIINTPQNVQSVYIDQDGEQYFQKIVNGVYGSYGSSILGEPLVNSGWLLYFEKKNDRQQIDGGVAKYRKHALKDWKGEPVEELTSEYGVFQKSLVSNIDEKRLGVRGMEVTIRNLKTEQTVATLTYFTSSRQRTICGQPSDGNFSVSNFIRKSLNLKKQFPDAFSQAAIQRP